MLQLCRSSFSQLLGSPHCSRLRLSLSSFTDRKREEGERERWQGMSFKVFRADPHSSSSGPPSHLLLRLTDAELEKGHAGVSGGRRGGRGQEN